jgi:hypothetical protein
LLAIRSDLSDRGSSSVDLAHEVLIGEWEQLKKWLDASREERRLREELSETAKAWGEHRDDESFVVHRGSRLLQVEELLKNTAFALNEGERDYIASCIGLREREKAREDVLRRRNLAETGWGVIFARDADPAILDALRELLDHRRGQATQRDAHYYRQFSGEGGYWPGDLARTFLARHGAGSGACNPNTVPYYLLIVGDPETIPYDFQYQLDVQYAVGRIHFETLEEYSRYAHSVVEAEARNVVLPPRIIFFAPQHAADTVTNLAVNRLVKPLAERIARDWPKWAVQCIVGPEATKAHLSMLLGGDETPALLFTASHGVLFSGGDERQYALQGALICALPHGRALGPNDFFAANDVDQEAHLLGTIAFFFAVCSGGTSRTGFGFPHQREESRPARAFVAQLPQRMLALKKGGALAVIGHVDELWVYSFLEQGDVEVLEPFAIFLSRLMDGHPVGSAIEPFNQRYAELSSELVLETAEEPEMVSDKNRAVNLRIATIDARNWIVLGDPAVRLPVG